MRWFIKRGLYRTRDNGYVIFRKKLKVGHQSGQLLFTELLTGKHFPVPPTRKSWMQALVYCNANVKCRVTKYDK